MALRFDTGTVKSVHKSPEGFLIVKGTATRTGVFNYRNPDGTLRRELRHPDDVLHPDSLGSLAGKPLTLEHPPALLTPDNVEQHSVGSVGNKIHVVGDGLIEIVGNVHRRDAIAATENKTKRDLSCGYTCEILREDGVYKSQPYDFRQTNIVYNHLAIVQEGRAGSTCGLHLDSADDVAVQENTIPQITYSTELNSSKSINSRETKRMGTTVNLDGVTYNDVPENFAPIAAGAFKELTNLRSRLDSLQSELDSRVAEIEVLEEQNEELENERDRERGRGDALEIQVEEAREQLFERDDTGLKAGSKKKKNGMNVWEQEEPSEEEEMTPEELQEWLKKKKKHHKTDSASSPDFATLMSEVNAAASTWDQGEQLIAGFRKDNFDNTLKAPQIQKLILQKLKPKLNLDSRDEVYIQARFDSLVEQFEEETVDESTEDSVDMRQDSGRDHTTALAAAVQMARSGGRRSNGDKANAENIKRMSQNWQTPLAMSKK